MWEIYYALPFGDVIPMVQTGRATIEKARLIASSYLDKKTVYAGRAFDYFEADNDDTIIVHRHDMILVRGVDTENVFNEICSILERYNHWESTIAGMVGHENGLQEMLDASKDVLQAPGYVYAHDGHAYAISQGYSPDVHWHWAEILNEKGMPSTRMRELRDTINLPEVWKDTFPQVRSSYMGEHEYMHCSLYPNGYMAGHFVLFGFGKPFNNGLERVANTLVRYMTKHMELFYTKYSPTSKLAESFALFLTQEQFDESAIALSLRALHWQFEDTFRFYVVRERGGQEPVMLSQLYNMVTNRFLFVIAFMLDGSLVIVENETRQGTDGLSSHLHQLLSEDFYCGVSVSFDDLRESHMYYLQARNEARRCARNKARISQADDHGMDQIHEALRDAHLLWPYAAREIAKVKQYDVENGTQYYETLRAYVLSCFHLSDAARYLEIHRNSLTYRLDRIREEVDLSVVDKAAATNDIETMSYLILSFAIIDAAD